MMKALCLLAVLALAVACVGPKTLHVDARLRTEKSLQGLLHNSSGVVAGVVLRNNGIQPPSPDPIGIVLEDYTIEVTNLLKGNVSQQFVVSVVRSYQPLQEKRAIENPHYLPLTVGGRYVLFLGTEVTPGRWAPAPEPWRFRVTESVRPESPWDEAKMLFPPQSLGQFMAAVQQAKK